MNCSVCAFFQEISNPNKKENSHYCLLCGIFMEAVFQREEIIGVSVNDWGCILRGGGDGRTDIDSS